MKFTPDQIQLLVANKIIPKNTPPAQIEFFLEVCVRKKLDPFLKQIHMVERNERNADGSYSKSYTIQASIDGMRAIAQRNVKVLKYERGVISKKNYDIKMMNEKMKLYGFCKIITSDRGEYYDEVCFDEYVQRTRGGEMNHFWKQFPETMIKKCAEESVLRMLAPEDLSDIYGDDEMGDEPVISAVETTVVNDLVQGKEVLHISNGVNVVLESSEVVSTKKEETSGTVELPLVTAPAVKVKQELRNPDSNNYVPEDDFKVDFRKCKSFAQYLGLWNRLSPNQKKTKEEEFLLKMIFVAVNVSELSKLHAGCSHELKAKYADEFGARRNFLEGKVQENMFDQLTEEALMKEIDLLETKKAVKEFAKKSLKNIQKLEPLAYKRVTERLEKLEQKLVDY